MKLLRAAFDNFQDFGVNPVNLTKPPGAGWKKGQGENPVGHARGRLFVPRPRGTAYAEVTAWLSETGSAAPAQRARDPGTWGP